MTSLDDEAIAHDTRVHAFEGDDAEVTLAELAELGEAAGDLHRRITEHLARLAATSPPGTVEDDVSA
ncbi:hypothetical protein [Amycolatopsis solani]|uniref:hypothetical protein n=1 Tax=Amycolatopsis solani TaxID=3028615 RepID=UPI0025B02F28|nr:hypothetical protein [Amycolatopsis sp. MEP2-6]